MCGIFGIVGSEINPNEIRRLAFYSQQRGRDSSGLFFGDGGTYKLHRGDRSVLQLLKGVRLTSNGMVMGHSRLITNGLADNQPVYRDGVCVIHNGIIVNHDALWMELKSERRQEIDTEVIAAIVAEHIKSGGSVESASTIILERCKGVVACALAIPAEGKLCLFSNNGSLFVGSKGKSFYFASERYPLLKLKCGSITQVRSPGTVIDIPMSSKDPEIFEELDRRVNLLPGLGSTKAEEALLQHPSFDLKRCSRCILPESMPFIRFNADGVCNYCTNYKPRNRPKPVEQLSALVEPFRKMGDNDCIVPFSGGRDSCYALHLISTELKMQPIAYTYDWGMVTDLGRRNISRMCAALGVENIIIAADISQKRRNIAKNFNAWLKSPNLGMVSIFTAGDKHFFRHVETVKRQTGISLNLWGVNPLEVTHFKAGFLGVPPDFEEDRVYSSGAMKQARYQWLRLKAMCDSPDYFNSSLWDTLTGEYYRSFASKRDYHHVFDYWRWDEKIIDDVLLNQYEWERAPDTKTTWRIGDGTAAIYNYIYYTVAGFTEHDTFRSNQVREGDLSREQALALVEDENQPRYPNIKWYLDAVGLDFATAIRVINSIPKVAPGGS